MERLLGKGGMGYVMAARHVQLDERVALKFLLPECLKHEEVVNRFAREARAAVKIRSEHVARVTDVGNLENGTPYLVMEYLEGIDLSGYIERQKALPVQEAVDYVLQACVAIAEAHSLGIVHRDLKPSNLFLSKRADGTTCIKVLDFGISKMSDPGSGAGSTTDQQSMTKTSSSLGSPLYMSPEQMTAAKTVSGLTDIWALGVILFELLTGTQPFQGESVAHLFINIATTPPASIRALRPDLPQGLEAVILRCLEKQPSARYSNTADLARALAAYAPPQAGISIDRILRIMMGGSPAAGHGQQTDPSVRTLALNSGAGAAGAAGGAARPSGTGPIASSGTPQPRTQAMQAITPNTGQAQASAAVATFSQTPHPQHPQQTRSNWGTTGPEPPPQIPVNRGLIIGAAVLFFLVIATGGFFGIRHFVSAGGGGRTVPSGSASVSVAVAPPPPPPSSSPIPLKDEAVDAGTEAKKLTPPPPNPIQPPNPNPNPQPPNPLPIPPTPSVQPQPPQPPQPPGPTPKPTPSVNPNCNPNYYFDQEGNKHFKPQCFGKT